jgi:hypothetical protein
MVNRSGVRWLLACPRTSLWSQYPTPQQARERCKEAWEQHLTAKDVSHEHAFSLCSSFSTASSGVMHTKAASQALLELAARSPSPIRRTKPLQALASTIDLDAALLRASSNPVEVLPLDHHAVRLCCSTLELESKRFSTCSTSSGDTKLVHYLLTCATRWSST